MNATLKTSEVAALLGLHSAAAARVQLVTRWQLMPVGRDVASGEKLWPAWDILLLTLERRGRGARTDLPPKGTASPVPTDGALGALVLAGWVAAAPTGRDEAFLLLTTPSSRAGAAMAMIADLLGLTGPPGSPSAEPRVYVTFGADRWITLHTPGRQLARPGGGEWTDIARATGRAVLVVGTAPRPAGMDPDTYTDQHGDTARIGLIPVKDASTREDT